MVREREERIVCAFDRYMQTEHHDIHIIIAGKQKERNKFETG